MLSDVATSCTRPLRNYLNSLKLSRELDRKRTLFIYLFIHSFVYLFVYFFIYLSRLTPPHYKYIVHLSIRFLILTVLNFQLLSGPSQFNWLQLYKGSYCYVTVFLVWTVLTLVATIELPQLRRLVPLTCCHLTVKVENLIFRTGQLANGESKPHGLVVCW